MKKKGRYSKETYKFKNIKCNVIANLLSMVCTFNEIN